MSNQQIAKLLRNIAIAYTIKNEKKLRFQIIAYQKAADAVSNLTSEVYDYYKEDKLDSLPGIGVSIRSHLVELFKKGKVSHFEWALKGIPKSVFVLTDVPTFGPKRAYRLVKEFKLNNPQTVIDDLEKRARKREISKLEGFGEKSEKDILRALKEFKLGKGKTTRMVLPYAFDIAKKMVAYVKKSKYAQKAEPLGSLRRMMPTVGDIDIAVASNHPKEVIEHFTKYPYKERVIEKGDITSSILVSGGRQVDLMIQPPHAFGSLLQHFTGSKNHNIALREFALKKGLSLSEYGIKRRMENGKWKMENYDSEEKFYTALGLDWIPPEMRENTGEIELSERHKLPRLVELKDINGDLHLHSSFPIEPSHDLGKNTIKEITEKAEIMGYQYIGFSEHNPSISKHTKTQILSLIKARNKEIDQILSGNKNIRILKLLEIDVLPNGSLAVSNEGLNLLDGAVVSIHSSFNMDENEMTKRVILGLTHPKAKILAHPTGRILNERSGYELDWEKIFNFCKKNNKALEINSWPSRLDPPDPIIRLATEKEVKFIINTDSHALWQMELMMFGVAIARRGWAKKSDILNNLSYNEFVKWLKS
ncbi:MAG: hypothetical protein A2958_03215 [Candidatus Levybacteria bacterium RIFCSPLOWO2_01_FULL_38_13]|nr:MAG: hypothetical protein A2629_03630 [Candidatus Levybacteria bacterium RIFCSPHIGHO2_01_FULL_41_15]OGH35325.1 MAG: hypothetical protein A2958_03215 [Candidatus Levybacteria bacterium RIFCSPLOWO2_01_FULL_38_13]